MTRSEHYLQAEKLLAAAEGQSESVSVTDLLARAQVHATLALAAASAGGAQDTGAVNQLACGCTEVSS